MLPKICLWMHRYHFQFCWFLSSTLWNLGTSSCSSVEARPRVSVFLLKSGEFFLPSIQEQSRSWQEIQDHTLEHQRKNHNCFSVFLKIVAKLGFIIHKNWMLFSPRAIKRFLEPQFMKVQRKSTYLKMLQKNREVFRRVTCLFFCFSNLSKFLNTSTVCNPIITHMTL